jgi:hypothetical protein
MFDLRYHVASLAAVFLALVIGILVGVGISDRGLVDKAQRGLLEQRVNKLESDLAAARRRARDVAAQQRATQAFVDETYPTLIANRLRGKKIALVFLGPTDPRVRVTLDQALADSGATGWARVRSVKLPLDISAMDGVLAKHESLAGYAGDARLPALGRALGEELAAGGDTPLWKALAEQIVAERTGSETQRADGVIVVRTGAKQYDGTSRFLQGFYDGLIAAPVPVVGVGTSTGKAAPIAAFRRNGISTVDDVDQATGRLALALLLAGAKAGQYGLQDTAKDGILPPLESLGRG